MGSEAPVRSTPTLRDHLRVVHRRKWLILQAVVVLPLAAIVFSLQQERLYQSSAEVLLSRQNLAATLTNTQDPTLYQQAERVVQTEAAIARVPAVARRVLKAAGLSDRTPAAFLEASSVSAKQNADLLDFEVTDPSPELAARLATEYARQFTIHRRQLDTAAFKRARREIEGRIRRLEAEGDRRSPLYASLVDKDQQLRTLEALQTSNAYVVHSAGTAVQVQPRPVRNGVLGLALGVVLGIGIAFLWEALDTRVRSTEEVGERLGMQLLGRIPEPPRRLRKARRPVMLAEPYGPQAETFRTLRTYFEFVNLRPNARTVMVTSAVEGEGKTTTVANLAVALARLGRSVLAVDLDLRRPALDRFFHLDGRPGVTDVALGRVQLEDAIVSVAVAQPADHGAATTNGNGDRAVHGILEILPAGPVPPDPGEFVGSEALADILRRLHDRAADVVLVDAPPLLRVGDAVTLSRRVDGLVLVARLNVLRRPMLNELDRVLQTCPAAKLGFVLTGSQRQDAYGYGNYHYHYYHAPVRRESEPVG